MTIYEFIKLDINSKADMLWDKGIFLENTLSNNQGINLYFLDNFFVEVIVSKPNEKIIDIVPFKQGERLEKYIEGVTIPNFK
ncbi:MAG: hypothetical protein Q8L81_16870 [Bacteroidota bacterium]|nr:hypothetical protein [Bacteroidota bacterium]